MLIRWAVKQDKAAWIKLAKEVAPIFQAPTTYPDEEDFQHYMDSKIRKYEALIAVDRMTNNCMGIIGFSRSNNRITWLGIFDNNRRKGIGYKLLKCALNNLDPTKEITVETFRKGYELGEPVRRLYEKAGFNDLDDLITDNLGNPRCKMALESRDIKKGYSFHHQYPHYAAELKEDNCPVCQKMEPPIKPVLIKEMDYAWLECSMKAQGCLFGKCHVLSKVHAVDFYDMTTKDMINFMTDVQVAAKALQKVTGAVKINYEIHGNSMPHLHVHLFPRYLDDQFPGAGIDVKLTEPSPYESEEEFLWFVDSVRKELDRKEYSNLN